MEDHIIELIKRAQAGDEEAFTEVFHRYYKSVYIKAYSFLKNDADAKDAAQITFLEVHRSLKDLREITSFYAWLMMVVSSKSLTMLQRRKNLPAELEGMENTTEFKEDRSYMDPIKYAHNTHEKAILMEIINSLTKKQAEIVKLIYFDELKLVEIAELLDLPLGTIKTRSVKAKKELRNKIEAYERDEHCRLNFKVDAIIPSAMLAFSIPKLFTSSFKQAVKTACHSVQQNSVLALCSTSMVALTVSGGAFVYEDYQEYKQQPKQVQTQPNTQNTESVSQQDTQDKGNKQDKPNKQLPANSFKPIMYEEINITSLRESYFVCLNFAQSEQEMMEHTATEIQNIAPLVQQLKETDSPYYQELSKKGWISWYESYKN